MPKLTTATPTNYSKWEQLDANSDDSDDGSRQPVEPLLESKKSDGMRDRDERTAQRFLQYMAEHLADVPSARRNLGARFVASCDPGERSTNVYRYADIVSFCTRYKDELLGRPMVDSLCELHKRMVQGVADIKQRSDPVLKDADLLLGAINALEACRRYPNAAVFFEAVCQPSRGDRARAAAEAYAKGEFSKRAMLRYMFKGDAGWDIDEDQEDLDHFLGGEPRKKKKLPPLVDPELAKIFALLTALLGAMAIGGWLFYQGLKKMDSGAAALPPGKFSS